MLNVLQGKMEINCYTKKFHINVMQKYFLNKNGPVGKLNILVTCKFRQFETLTINRAVNLGKLAIVVGMTPLPIAIFSI